MIADLVDGRDALLRVALVDAFHNAAPDAAGVAEALAAGVLVALECTVRVPYPNLGDLYTESGQTLQGSFSAGSKPNFASKYALELAICSKRRLRKGTWGETEK